MQPGSDSVLWLQQNSVVSGLHWQVFVQLDSVYLLNPHHPLISSNSYNSRKPTETRTFLFGPEVLLGTGLRRVTRPPPWGGTTDAAS